MHYEQITPLPAPPKVLEGADMRVQEVIYGHRLVQEQEPYMILLETLAVCASKPLGTVQPEEKTHESFSYDLPHRRKMRFLLFADRHLETVANDDSIPDDENWAVWKRRVTNQFQSKHTGHDDFAFLDSAFDRKVELLLQAVRLLRSQEVDVIHNRRWTSRFLTVAGPNMICADMREGTNGSWSADRRFFGRGGELVYLMLNRSSRAKEIGDMVQMRFLDPENSMNRVAKSISDPESDVSTSTHIGYLPLSRHAAYDRLAYDWHGILSLGLPNGHLFEPLFRITGLNLVVYLAERARDVIGMGEAEPIVADLTDGADKQLRDSSKEHLNRHRQAAIRAVEAFIEQRAAQDEGWNTAVLQGDGAAAKDVIERLFFYKSRNASPADPQRQLKELNDQAKSRPKNNAYKYLLPLVKGIGLASSRQRIGTWFAIDDDMIFALVMANVSHTIELRDFVGRLYERYGIVIGPEEARKAFSRLPVGVQSFEANLIALENRMTRLALTRRLSDDCAFVTNPYRHDND